MGGVVADKGIIEELERLQGRPFNHEALRHMPVKDHLLMWREAQPERIGNIIIPDQAMIDSSTGWIVAVGPLCSSQWSQFGPVLESALGPNREEWLGVKVTWGMYTENVLLIDEVDKEGVTRLADNWRGPYLISRETDLKAIHPGQGAFGR